MPDRLQRGDVVTVTHGDQRVRAIVALAAGHSAILIFAGTVAGHDGAIHVERDAAGAWWTNDDLVVTVTRDP